MRPCLAIALVVVAFVTTAHAAGDDEERARGHYEIGLGLYRLGDYRAAAREFAAGYELAHKPGFLLNLGQTYRKLGEVREARDMYRQFLAEIRSDDPARPQAQQVLAELEEAIRHEPAPTGLSPKPTPATPAESSPPATPPDEAPPIATPAPAVAPPAAAVQGQVQAPAARAHHRGLRIAGLTLGIAGLGLLGGGIGAAVAAESNARDLNALDHAGGVFDASKDSAYTLDRTLEASFLSVGGALTGTAIVLLVLGAR
jgi:tetratricopeptide (TPR) repeat protein